MKHFIGITLCFFLLTSCSLNQASLSIPADRSTTALGTTVPNSPPPEPTQAPSTLDPLLQELHTLTKQRKSDLLAGLGWLHLRTRHTDPQASQLPTIGLNPSQYEQEKWLYLDSQGKITREVERKLNELGQVVKISVLENGIWRSLPSEAEDKTHPVESFTPNLGFYELAALLVQQGRQVNKQTLYYNCWYLGEQYRIVDGKAQHEAVFNPDTGKLRWLKSWDTSSSVPELTQSVEVLVEERVAQPPSDALILLGKASAP